MNDGRIRYIGRWISTGTEPRSGWPGASARIAFEGDRLRLDLGPSVKGGWGAVKVRVDGRTVADVPLTDAGGPVEVAKGLDAGKVHVADLICRIGAGFSLKGVEIAGNADLHQAPAGGRVIKFCGDSITEGLFNVPMGIYDQTANPECYEEKLLSLDGLQDTALAYGPLVAGAFGADFTLIAKSGIGMVRCLGPSESDQRDPFPVRHEWWTVRGPDGADGFDWRTSEPVPDLVVVFLGANDVRGGAPVPLKEFLPAYTGFLDTLRKSYPPATRYLLVAKKKPDGTPDTIDLVRPVFESQLAAGHDDIAYVEVGTGDAARFEPDATHSNFLGHRIFALAITDKIHEWLGWQVVRPVPDP